MEENKAVPEGEGDKKEEEETAEKKQEKHLL